MRHPNSFVESASVTEMRAATPSPEERLPQTFKSLFTLADVATRRRANRNVRKLTVRTDENRYSAASDDDAGGVGALNLRRSKSSGDVAVLGENTRALNATSDAVAGEPGKPMGPSKSGKAGRGRAATTASTSPSKIPKAKSPTSLSPVYAFPPVTDEDETSSILPTTADGIKPDTLSVVDDALFVMLTPPQTPAKKTTKSLTLAAHVPSLPKVASPFSPRTNTAWTPGPRASTRSSPGTGHTSASLHLTKSHWELRYEAWVRSLRIQRRPRSARSTSRPASIPEEETVLRSRFPEPPTNPALFPRAGMLTPKALRHNSVGSDEDGRSALELDWALRAWPMDKIQRTLFAHDMDVRTWFPVKPSRVEEDYAESLHSDLDLRRVDSGSEDDDEKERERSLRRWEWDWELRWRVIEGMVEDDNDRERAECEYDVFLAEGSGRCQEEEEAYGGCEAEETERPTTPEEEWEWNENAMEIDAVL